MVNKPRPLAAHAKRSNMVDDAEVLLDNKLRSAFQSFDQTNCGYISIMNLPRVVDRLGDTISNDELSEIKRKAVSDQNGQLSFSEFAEIMRLRSHGTFGRHGQLQDTGPRDLPTNGSGYIPGSPKLDLEQVVKNMILMRNRLEASELQHSDSKETSSTALTALKKSRPAVRWTFEGILERTMLIAQQRARAKSAGEFVAAVGRTTDVADKLNSAE